ncbi:MAG: hypothetical protein MZU91_08645 [Desulfosudis oleivorans]|nr:hypothetical protein [Desulfosudis oleivorans]
MGKVMTTADAIAEVRRATATSCSSAAISAGRLSRPSTRSSGRKSVILP